MDIKKFNQISKSLINSELEIFKSKGKEYSGTENVFSNFERVANDLDLDRKQVLWVYAMKHKDSIATFLREGQTYSNEDILGRIMDLRIYLQILYAMIKEEREKNGF